MNAGEVRASDLPPDQVTLAELVRWLGRIERQHDIQVKDLERQLEGLKYVTTDRYDAEQRETARRLDRVEGDVSWSRRAQLGTLLTVLGSTALLFLQSAGTI